MDCFIDAWDMFKHYFFLVYLGDKITTSDIWNERGVIFFITQERRFKRELYLPWWDPKLFILSRGSQIYIGAVRRKGCKEFGRLPSRHSPNTPALDKDRSRCQESTQFYSGTQIWGVLNLASQNTGFWYVLMSLELDVGDVSRVHCNTNILPTLSIHDSSLTWVQVE